jgi:hypothetical protein
VDLIVAAVVLLILSAAVFVGAGTVCLRAVERRAAERDRALFALAERLAGALAPLRVVLPPSATAAPARGLQRLPTAAFPPIVRRVVDVTRESDTPAAPMKDSIASGGAIVNVEFSGDQRFDSTGGRWLKEVLGASRSSSQPPVDDTPAPMAQREPILPSPSSSPLRPSRR